MQSVLKFYFCLNSLLNIMISWKFWTSQDVSIIGMIWYFLHEHRLKWAYEITKTTQKCMWAKRTRQLIGGISKEWMVFSQSHWTHGSVDVDTFDLLICHLCHRSLEIHILLACLHELMIRFWPSINDSIDYNACVRVPCAF